MLIPTYLLTGYSVTIVIITMTTDLRIEDLTNRDVLRNDPKCDRTVSLYGYVRGAPIRNNCTVHIAGETRTFHGVMVFMASQVVEISQYKIYQL